jgi:hypothetical protein
VQSGAHERFLFVVSQSLQVLFRTTESNRVAQGSGGRHVVDDFFGRATEELAVEELKVLFFGERNPDQVFDMADSVDADAIAIEHPAVKYRMLLQIKQRLAQQQLLISLYFFGRAVFYVGFNAIHNLSGI